MRGLLGGLAGGAAKRPLAVIALAALLGAGGAALATGLSPSAATDTFVGRSSSSYKATEAFYSHFGQEPIQVVVKGNLQRLLLSSDIERLLGLEGCLSGRVPTKALPAEGGVNGPCGRLSRLKAVKVVIGPGTFVNEAAEQLDAGLERRRLAAQRQARQAEAYVRRQALKQGLSEAEADSLGEEARKANLASYAAEVSALAVRYGLDSIPSLTNQSFVSTLAFDSSATTPGTPKQRFAYLFPSREAALVSVRLKAGLSDGVRAAALEAIRAAVSMRQWHLTHGERYLITGEPVIVSELASAISKSVLLLLIAVAVAMALTLSLVFRGRPRLLPLGVAALALALTFGALSVSGSALSIGEVAVLPVLTGLAVDYAIQLHSRASEALAGGEADVKAAVLVAARSGGPSIVAAASASAAAILVLELSPVPTVRDFSTLLVVGLAIALLCALTVGSAAIVLAAGARSRRGAASTSLADARSERSSIRPGTVSGTGDGRPREATNALKGWPASIAAAWRGAAELLLDNRLTRLLSRVALQSAVRRPGRAIAIGLVLAAAGWGLAGQTPVQTDITKLVPQDMPSLRNLATLERLSGVGGEVDLTLSGKDLLKPRTIEWMERYEARMLARFGYRPGHGCGRARLCPAFSLPDLFRKLTGEAASSKAEGTLTKADVNGLLKAIPPYFSQDVITPSRKVASIAFGVRLMPLSEQQQMIEAMRSSLRPPAGVSAHLVGLPVLAAEADAQVASASRRTLELLLGILLVAAVLLVAFGGDLRRALVPLVPVALASGWSALVLFVVRVPLNPMSVMLGALVIAIGTEFSVLLSERYREERLRCGDHQEALTRAYRGTGAAIAASGVTAIVGFGVLVLSDIAMLRDFGFVTLIDLILSLLGVMLVLPAALTLAQTRPRRAGAADRGAFSADRGAFSEDRGAIAADRDAAAPPAGRARHGHSA